MFYSQLENPKQFIPILLPIVFGIILIFGVGIGYLGYFTFGNTIKPLIIFNLPPSDPLSVIAKVCFLINILGSLIIDAVSNFNVIEKSDWYNKGCCYSE